jgi:hypothetical protein
MNGKRTIASLALVFSLGAGSVGCHPRVMGNLLGAAIVTAAIVGTAAVLAQHDAHFHDEYCGHARRFHQGRWVYHYNGHWEYYEGGRWYYYQGAAHHPPPAVY